MAGKQSTVLAAENGRLVCGLTSCTDTFCPSAVRRFENALWAGRLGVALGLIFVSHGHVGWAWLGGVLSCPLAEFQICGLFVIYPTRLLSSEMVCFQSFRRKRTVECVLVAALLWARCGECFHSVSVMKSWSLSGPCCWSAVK